MPHFLLVYDRSEGKLVREQRYESGDDALSARFAAEAEFSENADIEVVTLSAESEEALRNTHGRYFFSLQELVERMAVA